MTQGKWMDTLKTGEIASQGQQLLAQRRMWVEEERVFNVETGVTTVVQFIKHNVIGLVKGVEARSKRHSTQYQWQEMQVTRHFQRQQRFAVSAAAGGQAFLFHSLLLLFATQLIRCRFRCRFTIALLYTYIETKKKGNNYQ